MKFLYNALFTIFFWLAAPFYFVKMWRRGNWQQGFAQRFGRTGADQPWPPGVTRPDVEEPVDVNRQHETVPPLHVFRTTRNVITVGVRHRLLTRR